MSKVKITKRCYRAPNSNSTVNPGVYDASDFSSGELEFLQSLEAIVYVKEVKVETVEETTILSAPVTIAKEETIVKPTRKRRSKPISESKE